MARSSAQLRAIFAALRGMSPLGRARRLRKAGIADFGQKIKGRGGKHLLKAGTRQFLPPSNLGLKTAWSHKAAGLVGRAYFWRDPYRQADRK